MMRIIVMDPKGVHIVSVKSADEATMVAEAAIRVAEMEMEKGK